ncbi:hypothetical protein FOF52_05880 [Thermobifida alba]|uniref:DUF418 domain-containing protein n=2 Tax=Thermobifida alba TaxID=53522 RepID=A0ABY4L6U0_THEAE|nr:hypothetical protein FOF52_05880 [Thermobifida alba]
MFVVHVGVGWTLSDGSNPLQPVAAGRSAALFALLAGVSIALMSGGRDRKVNKDLGVALWRVVVRAVIMLALGTALTMLGTPVSVILAYYAVLFVFTCMLLTERWGIIAGAAAVLGVVGPIVSFWVRSLIDAGGTPARVVATVNAYDPFVALADDGVVNFLLTGSYPAITWLPFIFAGLAIGRLDLWDTRVRWRLVALGAGLAAAAYTLSYLAVRVVGVDARLAATVDPDTGAAFGAEGFDQLFVEGMGGTVPTTDWAWLLVTAPHSGTPLDVYGAGGVAIALLGLCLIVTDALGRASWLVYPLASVGALALTTYVGHILVIWLDENSMLDGTPLSFVSEWLSLTVLLGALLFATLWRLVVKRRGPLEWPLHVVSSWVAKRIP